jgi:hypothetical protein
MDQDDSSSQSDESQTVQAVADNMADNLSDEDDDEDDGEEDFSVSEVAELNEEFDELNELDPSTEIKH